MKFTRTFTPTIFLLIGAAAAQTPVAPPSPPAAPYPAPVLAPAAPVPPARPWPAPAPVAVPLPPLPPDLSFRLEDAQDRLFELKNKFDFDVQVDFADKAAALAEAKAHLDSQAFKFENMAEVKAQIAASIDAANAGFKAGMGGFAFAPQKMGGRTQSDDRLYDAGQRALEQRRWDEALEDFNQVSARAGARADGAWYWKAYTLNKLGRRDEALAAIAELRKTYSSSRWMDDAKALELEVKQGSGQRVSPEAESDEELKLLALNGLVQSDPDRAFPLLESLLKSAQSPRLKKNAVYVLAQSNSPRASQLLEQVARGQGNPDLQLSAIRYLGEKRRQSNGGQILSEIYASSSDVTVKRAIIGSLESARDKDRLLQIARTEKAADLRMDAIRNLAGINSAQAELWQIYQSESDPQIRQQILEAMPQNGNLDKFLEVARSDKDAKLRRQAVQNLGSTRAVSTGDGLVSMYGTEQDQQVKNSIIDALYSQRNVKALVAAARSEKDSNMKKRILERLVNMRSPEANDYLMEILK